LFVADFFQPFDDFAVEMLLDGDMRHRGFWRSAMPVFLAGWNPDHISGPNSFDRTAPALYQTGAGSFARNKGLMRTVPVKYSAGPLLDGCEPFRVMTIFCGSFETVGAAFEPEERDDSFACADVNRKSDMAVAINDFIFWPSA
jgi:hypothetical protein